MSRTISPLAFAEAEAKARTYRKLAINELEGLDAKGRAFVKKLDSNFLRKLHSFPGDLSNGRIIKMLAELHKAKLL